MKGQTHTFNEDTGCLVGGCGPLLQLWEEVESVEGVHVLDVTEDDVLLSLQGARQNLRHKPRATFLSEKVAFFQQLVDMHTHTHTHTQLYSLSMMYVCTSISFRSATYVSSVCNISSRTRLVWSND